MIKIQLTHVDPFIIYSFLEEHIGKLYMTIRQNLAFIKFISPEHHQIAMTRYSSFLLKGYQIQLKPYSKEQIIIIKPEYKEEQIQVQMQPPSKHVDVQMQRWMQSMKVTHDSSEIEKIVKKYRKVVIEYVSNYDLFFKSVQQNNSLGLSLPHIQSSEGLGLKSQTQNQHKPAQVQRFVQNNLKGLFKSIKNEFKRANSHIKQFGNQRKINLDAEIHKGSITDRHLQYKTYSPFVQYFNDDYCTQAYRLRPLNQRQFMVTTNYRPQKQSINLLGKLKIYNINDVFQQNSIVIRERAYGLIALQEYILVGNYEGYITYMDKQNITKQELSCKLYDLEIKDILKINQRDWGYNIAALGRNTSKQRVKWLQVHQQEIVQNEKTLFFQEKIEILTQNDVLCLQLGFQDNNLILGNENSIQFYDLLKGKMASKIGMVNSISSIKKMKGTNFLAVANNKYISIVDLNSNTSSNQVNRYKFSKNITSLYPLNHHSIIYGNAEGQVGLFDLRRNGDNKTMWNNKINHKARIDDIIQLDNCIISCDSQGQIVSWNGN